MTPWIVVGQAPLSMGFSRQEYCLRLPFPSPGHFPDPGTEAGSLVSLALAGRCFSIVPPGKAVCIYHIFFNHFFVDEVLGCLHVLAILMVLQFTLEHMCLFELRFSLGICPGV